MNIPRLWYVVCPAALIPKGYGVGYRLYNQDAVVVLPIPINLIVRGLRYCYYTLVRAWYPHKWEQKIDNVWAAGYEEGRRSRQHEVEMLNLSINIYTDLIIKMKQYIGG